MNRHNCVVLMAVVGLVVGGNLSVARAGEASDSVVDNATVAFAAAEVAVEEARASIAKGQQLIKQVPKGSEFEAEIKQVIMVASENWNLAVSAIGNAKESLSLLGNASDPEITKDYALLATVNSGLALSSAKAVQTGLLFLEAAAENKTESLNIIRGAVHDAATTVAQVQMGAERVKKQISKKYSK